MIFQIISSRKKSEYIELFEISNSLLSPSKNNKQATLLYGDLLQDNLQNHITGDFLFLAIRFSFKISENVYWSQITKFTNLQFTKYLTKLDFQNKLPFHSDLVLTPTPAGRCEHEALQSVSSLPSNTEIVCKDQMTQYCDWMIQYSILNYL